MAINVLNMLKEESIVYVAGVIDSIGKIFISREKDRKQNIIYRPQIRLTSIHKKCLDYCIQTFGIGHIRVSSKLNDVSFYELVYRKKEEILLILYLLTPYLIIKIVQSQLMVKFIHDIENKDSHQGFYEEMKRINRRESNAM